MGDMGEVFNAMREHSKQKRANNRQSSKAMLDAHNIRYVTKNIDAHLIVEDRIDFWPGTGKWIVRGEKKHRRGVKKLIAYLRKWEAKDD